MMKSVKQIGIVAAAGFMLLAAPIAANANGFGENKPWQFRTANDLIALLYQAELMEKVEGGAYKNFGPADTYITNSTAIGNYNEVTIGDGACDGPFACNVHTDQNNEQSPTTAIGTGNNNTDNSGGYPSIQ